MEVRLLLICLLTLLSTSTSKVEACVEDAQLCYNDATDLRSEVRFNHTTGLSIAASTPQNYREFCQSVATIEIDSCLSTALAKCSADSSDEAMVLDLISAQAFRCNEENLDTYEANFDCYNTSVFGDGWLECYAVQYQETTAINTELFWASDYEELHRLLQAYCLSYEKYLECLYKSVNNNCGKHLAEFMYQQEVTPVKHTLNDVIGCDIPETYGGDTVCDINSAVTCLEGVNEDILGIRLRDDMEIMCSSLDDLQRTFKGCVDKALTGCSNDTLHSPQLQLYKEIPTSLQLMTDLCSIHIVPVEADCDYNALEICRNTVFASLDLDRKTLCIARHQLLHNFTQCIDQHLGNCPSATREEYRDLETEVISMWTSRDFNESCSLESNCAEDIARKSEDLLGCIPSVYEHHTTFDAVCLQNQEMLGCIEKVVDNCTPMIIALEETGFFDTLLETLAIYGCNGTIFERPIISRPQGCQLKKIYSCYNTFFQVIGIDMTTVEIPNLHQLSTQFLQAVKRDQLSFCSDMDTTALRECLDHNLPPCSYYIQHSILDSESENSSYHQVIYDQNSIFTYNIVMDAEAVCDTGCTGFNQEVAGIENNCRLAVQTLRTIYDHIEYFQYFEQYYNEPSLQNSCRDLKNYTDCVISSGGHCPYIRHHYLNYAKYFAPQISPEEVIQHCGITMSHACNKSFANCVHLENHEFPIDIYSSDEKDLKKIKDDLQTAVTNNQEHFCKLLSMYNVEKRRQCLNTEVSRCEYGDVYIDKYLTTITIVSEVHDKMCTGDCSNIAERLSSISSGCESEMNLGPLAELTIAIKNAMLEGSLEQSSCNTLQKVADCVSQKMGTCKYLETFANAQFFGEKNTEDAILACNTNYSTAKYPTSATETAGGGNVVNRSNDVWLVVMLLLVSYITLVDYI